MVNDCFVVSLLRAEFKVHWTNRQKIFKSARSLLFLTFQNASPIPDANGCCLNIKTSQFTNCAKLIAMCKLNDLKTSRSSLALHTRPASKVSFIQIQVFRWQNVSLIMSSSIISTNRSDCNSAGPACKFHPLQCKMKCFFFVFCTDACQSDYRAQTR